MLILAIWIVTLPVQISAQLPEYAQTDSFILVGEGLTTPEALGSPDLQGLGIADPAAAIVLVEPPEANNQGTAQLVYPLEIPAGRAGVQPQLTLAYSSDAGNGQTGLGWSLSVGEISIDTRWGVPRYLANEESETYLLDGEQLAPTAVRSTLLSRQADRVFTRRVEGAYERIRRMGAAPGEYWWEVTDKFGTRRFYGGTPEGGRDPDAILATDSGSGFTWALKQIRDKSDNTATFFYATVAGSGVGDYEQALGRDLYLDRIEYTSTVLDCDDYFGRDAPRSDCDIPAWEIDIVRASELGEPRRGDVQVDAMGGFLRVTSDLVRRIDIRYIGDGKPGDLQRSYRLRYTTGPFGKSLLSYIDQAGADGVDWATHEFTYYDDARAPDTLAYLGFAPQSANWNTQSDDVRARTVTRIATVDAHASALGGSESVGVSGVGYVGFNAAVPLKNGSFGAGFEYGRDSSGALLELLDINGDALPDKVFSTTSGIHARHNRHALGAVNEFGSGYAITDLPHLSKELTQSWSAGGEVYAGINILLHRGGSFTNGQAYFIDVNADLRPDFINNGRVLFNTDGSNARSFQPSSQQTPVPIDASSPDAGVLPDLGDLEAEQRENSPLVDTLRRWTAPWDGVIQVQGVVSLLPPVNGPNGDGVRVAIQHDDSTLWSTVIPGDDFLPRTPFGVGSIPVQRGDHIYFRLQSRDDGANDHVAWIPRIRYTDRPDATDANGLPSNEFHAARDFTLGGHSGSFTIASLDGTVRVTGPLTKTAKTTDDITIQVFKNGSLVADQVVGRDQTGEMPFAADFDVKAPDPANPDDHDEILLRLKIDSPIDLSKLSWAPLLYYLSATQGGEPVPVTDEDGNPTNVVQAPVDYQMYPANSLDEPQQTWTAPWDQEVYADPSIGFRLFPEFDRTGSVVLTVKKKIIPGSAGDPPSLLVAKKRLNFINGQLQNDDPTVKFTVSEGAQYWFDFSAADPEFAADWRNAGVVLRWSKDGMPRALPESARHWAYIPVDVFPMAYRGWGVAGYDGNGARADAPVDESRLLFDEDDYSEDSENPEDPKAFAFTPFVGEVSPGVLVREWRGPKSNMFASAVAAGSSRKGADSIGLVLADAGGAGGQSFRVPRSSRAPHWSAVGGFGGLIGLTGGWGQGLGLLDLEDMNGDQFPDIVSGESIQFTTPRGGLEANPVVVCNGWVRQDSNMTVSLGVGALGLTSADVDSKGQANTAQKAKSKSGQKGKSGSGKGNGGGAGDSNATTGLSVSIGGSLTRSMTNWPEGQLSNDNINFGELMELTLPGNACTPADTDEMDLADINGDGLPDRIRTDLCGEPSNGCRSKLWVNFNTGYGFDDTSVPWPGGYFETGFTDSQSLGGGVDIPPRAFSAGIGFSRAETRQLHTWVDLNGDGLLDQVSNEYGISGIRLSPKDDTVRVRFNTGAALSEAVVWPNFQKLDGITEVANSLTLGRDINAAFTFGIGPWCVAGCYVIITAGGSGNTNVSRSLASLVDVNGDGYPDHVTSDADDAMQVALNTHGRTNLLRSVDNPLGGRMEIDYQRRGNTVEQPFSQWVMSRVDIDDGRPGDGVDVQTTVYEYENNRYHHLERETLGYARVTETHVDTVSGSGSIRSIVRQYRNDSLFEKGLVTSETLVGPDGSPFVETVNTWDFVDANNQQPVALDQDASGLALLNRTVFARLSETRQTWFPNNGLSRFTRWEFDYDHLGNIMRVRDYGESIPEDDMLISIAYSDCENSTWVNLPQSYQVVEVSSGEVLRRRRAEQLCANNSPTALWEEYADGDEAHTIMEYDFYGNYGHIVGPPNNRGQRYELNYTYDYPRYTDIAHVMDSFGMEAEAVYAGQFGRMTARTDANGQQISYAYDAQGRMTALVAPYEQGTGNPTIAFEYFPAAAYPHAIARHYDAFHPGDTIDTAAFVDGRGRITQTQHDATVFRGIGAPTENVILISGIREFDAVGRVTREWQPTETGNGQLGAFQAAKGGYPTDTSWNFYDEVTEIIEPTNRVSSFEFSFGAAEPGAPVMLVREATDPEDNVTRTFIDTAGYVNYLEQEVTLDGTPTTLLTAIDLDPLDQLAGMTDPDGNVTTHVRDRMGRRIATDTPDGGLVEFVFDDASQQIARITPNLRATGQQIDYVWDFNRLVAIDYPDDTPAVHYEYGEVGGAPLQVGRIVLMDDGTRIEKLLYGRMGEVVKETNTMLSHNVRGRKAEALTWTMTWDFDSWGRPFRVTYPDGEVVSYDFDAAGRIRSVTGLDAGNEYPYVTLQAYDEFGMRRYQETGNHVSTTTEYYPDSRWLKRHATSGPARDVQDITYTYDLVGNIATIVNASPEPVASLMGGTSEHRYTYDELHRLVHGKGFYLFGTGKNRQYRYDLGYDAVGNIVRKVQRDDILNANGRANPQQETSYSHDYIYAGLPHQATRVGDHAYSYDANGNLLARDNLGNGTRRDLSWDAENRLTSVADQGSTTDYRYNDENQLAVERGPQGETLFVNRYYTVRNGTVAWKHIWAGDDQVATKRQKERKLYEDQQFLLHKDLRGNVRIVTDTDGQIYEYHEYFPGGEGWIVEHSNTERVPYRYLSAYFDEERAIYNLKARWYDPRDQVFHSTDPALEDSLDLVAGRPSLQSAYTYADNNPLRYVDREGRTPTDALISHLEGRLLGGKSFTQKERNKLIGDVRAHAASGLRAKLPKRLRRVGVVSGLGENDNQKLSWIPDAVVNLQFRKESGKLRPRLQSANILGISKNTFKRQGQADTGADSGDKPRNRKSVKRRSSSQ